ncbi:MAG TPA: leishmanolysin-related zinc metalloendopeptidase [Gemmatimonadaceae bacterium]|nr:leishmanolysin-related zinc metalloendopeptidase [Gemmatimonadaceae bacterium]
MRQFVGALIALVIASGCGSDGGSSTSAGAKPASIQLKLPTITLDAIGATRNDTAVALDASGNTLTDAAITWTSNSSVVSLALPTAVGGLEVLPVRATAAATAPVTGPAVVIIAQAAGTAVVTATSGGKSTRVNVTVAPIPAQVVIISGDQQTGSVGTALPNLLRVKVLDRLGVPIGGQTVTFTPAAGSGSVSQSSVKTDANGTASVTWTLGATGGTQHVTATAGTASATFTATATSAFSIVVQFLGTMSGSQQTAFNTAAARWSTVITTDLPDVPINIAAGQCGDNSPAMNQSVDDVLIFATIAPIDGAGKILGTAGPCFVRSSSGLPIVGEMTFDEADVASMEANGSFTSVVLHEMGHVLGIGTFWPDHGLQNQTLEGGTPQDTYFSGTNAVIGFNAIGGLNYTAGQKVPVENTGGAGTINSHWRESVLGNELMTGFLSGAINPLSVLTVRSLQDLGYSVNVAAADPFNIATALRSDVGVVKVQMPGDIRTGPLYSIDNAGTIRRIR